MSDALDGSSRVLGLAWPRDGHPLDRGAPRVVWVRLSTVLLAEAGLTVDAAADAVTSAVHALYPEARVDVRNHDTRGWQGVCHHSYDTNRHWTVDEPVGVAIRRVLEPAVRAWHKPSMPAN